MKKSKTGAIKRKVHGNAVQAKNVRVSVRQSDIDDAQCGLPTKCMIKVALKRALNLAHGYIHVDATGVSISRNGRYREKAFLPLPALRAMIAFDRDKRSVKPFSFGLKFFKTTPIRELDSEAKADQVRRAKKNGNAKKRYDMRERVVGLAVAGGYQVAA